MIPALRWLAVLQPVQDTTFQQFVEGVPPTPPPIPSGITDVLRTIFNAPLWMWLVGLAILGATATILLRQV